VRSCPGATPFIALLALFGCAALPAAADPLLSDDIYGQVSGGLMSVDDGASTTSVLVDNGNSPTRIGLLKSSDLRHGKLEFRFELGLGFRASNQISQGALPDLIDFGERSIRFFDLSYSGRYGTLSFGQGSMSTDGAAGRDLSGTTLAAGSSVSDIAAGFAFTTANGAITPTRIGGLFRNLDGGRRFRIRYDTPSRNGYTLSVASGQEVLNPDNDSEYFDMTLRHSADVGDIRTELALGYERVSSQSILNNEHLIASGAFLHRPSGWNFAFATGMQLNGNEATYRYGKVGLRRSIFDAGETRFSLDYYHGSDFGIVGTRAKSAALAVVQEFEKRDLEAFFVLPATLSMTRP
jgi:hypothetical protein